MAMPASEVPLRSSKLQTRYRAIVLLGLIPLAGCIAHAPGSGNKQTQILVTVSPSTPPPLSVPVSTAGQPPPPSFFSSLGRTSQSPQPFGRRSVSHQNAGLYYAPELGTATSATTTITAVAQFDPTQQSLPTTMNVLSSDPLGTVASFTNVSPCPSNGGLTSGNPTCFQLNTSCPGVDDF